VSKLIDFEATWTGYEAVSVMFSMEIRNMNEGKVGAPFEYSHSYIHFLAFLKIGFKTTSD